MPTHRLAIIEEIFKIQGIGLLLTRAYYIKATPALLQATAFTSTLLTSESRADPSAKDRKMPSDNNFAFRVLVGRVPLPEYEHKGQSYVESNLWTPYSYQQETTEYVNGEKEVQNFPVTPYEILLRLGAHCETSAFFIYVDGVLVTRVLLEKGETR